MSDEETARVISKIMNGDRELCSENNLSGIKQEPLEDPLTILEFNFQGPKSRVDKVAHWMEDIRLKLEEILMRPLSSFDLLECLVLSYNIKSCFACSHKKEPEGYNTNRLLENDMRNFSY